jgi:hypothetical protein
MVDTPSGQTVFTDRFVPQQVRPKQAVAPIAYIADDEFKKDANRVAMANFLLKNQFANPRFDPGTIGDSSYLGDVNQKITRGYIRRSSPTTNDPMSMANLNFMYNPEAVIRDYVSYLDQEALDPFNTVYGSGNLIAPPSFINFSFNLFFDRQVQTSNGFTPKGVLEDYDFFDMVVRNVAPGGGTSVVPDNGIMMVNPKDIMVVFSEHLSVQGRPTNARVSFEKFNNEMTPTRMTISLTMIVTYFGPVREAFALDTNQAIKRWEALMNYSEAYDNEVTQAEADAANSAFQKTRGDIAAFVNSIPRNAAWSSAGTTGAGVSGIAAGASNDLAGKTLQFGRDNINKGGVKTAYTQAGGRANLPTSADCSGALWCCYNAYGASRILHGQDGPASTASIANWGEKNGWQTMQIVCLPKTASVEQMRASIKPGDVILRRGHVGMFDHWDTDPNRWWFTHQTSGNNGTVSNGINYLRNFDWAIRPNPSGSTTTTGTWIPIGGTDPGDT